MDMVLMDKNIPVAELQMDLSAGFILNIKKLENPEYLPVWAKYNKDPVSGLRHWLGSRSIPRTRKNLDTMLQEAGVETADALSLKSLGLNLSDQYWFKPKDSNLQWEQVNLFENDFLQQRFSAANHTGSESSYTPDASSNGELPKFWLIKNGNRYLYKDSTAPYYQQAYNEVLASRLLDLLEVPHVTYELEQRKKTFYSICKTFITPETEYVPALYILDACKKSNSENAYQHFLHCMETLEIPCSKREIDTMLAFDYLINNSDRHYGNFGFIRNVDTLKFEGMAPLFDHGNSLWYQKLTIDMMLNGQESKPFKEKHEKQVKLITEAILPVKNLSEDYIQTIVQEVYTTNRYMDQPRLKRMVRRICSLIERVNTLQVQQNKAGRLSTQARYRG
jgi:hypothetical protein